MDVLARNKEIGIYYTPPILADCLAKPLVGANTARLLDPSYGEGSLLLAAERAHDQLRTRKKLNLFGCDIKPANGLLKHLPDAHLKKVDFVKFPTSNKFNVILMNPPFVRHHLLETSTINNFRVLSSEFSVLSHYADLWAYFLVKAVNHLPLHGSIGAILPWSFIEADYAQPLRVWLATQFKEIKVLAVSGRYFKDAEERVILLWLKGFGLKCETISLGSAHEISEATTFLPLSQQLWESKKIPFPENISVDAILSRYQRDFHFSHLKDHADVRIGVVTGADKYFIVSPERAQKLGLTKHQQIPVLTTSKDLVKVLSRGVAAIPKRLIKLKRKDRPKLRYFLEKGREAEYHLRAHSVLREPWYSVRIGKTPDAFFPYRATKIPFLVLNEFKIQCTNSVHRIYFKGLSKTEVRWIYISLLSVIGQLSLEVHSKTYGRGVLKLEPGSLQNALVLKKKSRGVGAVYQTVIKHLKKGDKNSAMMIATDFINSTLGVPEDLSLLAKQSLNAIQSARLPKNDNKLKGHRKDKHPAK